MDKKLDKLSLDHYRFSFAQEFNQSIDNVSKLLNSLNCSDYEIDGFDEKQKQLHNMLGDLSAMQSDILYQVHKNWHDNWVHVTGLNHDDDNENDESDDTDSSGCCNEDEHDNNGASNVSVNTDTCTVSVKWNGLTIGEQTYRFKDLADKDMSFRITSK